MTKLEKVGRNELRKVTLGSRIVWFAYETPVAFFSPKTGLVVSENKWGNTTGQMLNTIDNGFKGGRLPRTVFEQRLEEAFR